MAQKLIRSLGPVYIAAVKLRGSPQLSLLKARIGRYLYRLEKRPGLDVDLSGRIGMGALLAYALRLHALADERGAKPIIVSTSPLYTVRGDVFSRYFYRTSPPPNWKPHSLLATEWLLHSDAPDSIHLERAQAIFRQHFRPKPALMDLVTERYDLSVHFRGTDKVLETGHVPANKMLGVLQKELPDCGRGKRVFVATDDIGFARLIRETFPLASFTSFEIGTVDPGTPRHFSNLPPEDKALEALANIFLLANAPLCVRTASYLSAMAKIANPCLRTLTINQPPGGIGFPEDVILMKEASERLDANPRD